MEETSCKFVLEDINQLFAFASDKVRWLDIARDYVMIKEYFSLFGAGIESRNPEVMYFGINVHNYSNTETTKGKLCALIDGGKILSFGGIEYISPDTWEMCAGSTHPQHRSKGFSKAVCSFLARYILENGRQAVCETNLDNHAAQKALREIGMLRL